MRYAQVKRTKASMPPAIFRPVTIVSAVPSGILSIRNCFTSAFSSACASSESPAFSVVFSVPFEEPALSPDVSPDSEERRAASGAASEPEEFSERKNPSSREETNWSISILPSSSATRDNASAVDSRILFLSSSVSVAPSNSGSPVSRSFPERFRRRTTLVR